MARFSEALLTQIKQQVSLLRWVQAEGYEVVKQGKDYAVCCPFHEDKTPSCIISPKSNLFHCFGCGAAGSIIDWVMKTQGLSFRHAVEVLRDQSGLGVEPSPLAAKPLAADTTQAPVKPQTTKQQPILKSPVQKSTVPKLDAPIATEQNDQTVLNQVVEYYHHTLQQSPEAQDYLARRGLDDPELMNRFKLGYANRTLGLRLPQKNRQAGKALREQLQRIGLYRSSGHEHFNGSLVIPVLDEHGNVQEVYGRKLLDNLRKGTPKHLYLPGEHQGVFNLAALQCKTTTEIILCESLIDALTFYRWGFTHVTCSYGTQGFTDELLQALLDNGITRVLIAYDRDKAGDTAAHTTAATLAQHGVSVYRIQFPKGMDANSYACQMQPPQKALGLVIRKAVWLAGKESENAQTHHLPTGEVPLPLAAKEKAAADDKLAVNTQQQTAEHNTQTTPEKNTSTNDVNDTESTEKNNAELSNAPDANASPMPKAALADVSVEQQDNTLWIGCGERLYRVKGWHTGREDSLSLQLMAKLHEAFHLDKLDLTSSKQRQAFINHASVELGVNATVIKNDLGNVLLVIEEQLYQRQQEKNNNSQTNTGNADNTLTPLTDAEKTAALELLQDPHLSQRIVEDFTRAGVVGEATNTLVGYLACVSRKLDKPLAILIQSSSAAGKSSLMDAMLAFMPEHERVQYSAMTGQSVFYMGETNLQHKILAIAEEEGASNASYALKLLQSEGEITIASTGKDDDTGNLVTKEYTVQGPVMLCLTTTAIDLDEELVNRCLVLSVNESKQQTEAIHQRQRQKRTLAGLQQQLDKQAIVQQHRHAQRLLKPLAVINPYADQLTFLSHQTRTRRDHEKYLSLIDSIALLHQYQRPQKTIEHQGNTLTYIEVTKDDIALANHLAHEVLGRTLDELPPQTRKLLNHIQTLVQEHCQQHAIQPNAYRFSRKTIREYTGWSDGQLKIHCKRLEELEYLLVHRGGRGQLMEYELLAIQQANNSTTNNTKHCMGLLDIETLTEPNNTEPHTYDAEKLGQNGVKSEQKPKKSVPSQPQVRAKSDPAKSPQATALNGLAQSSQANLQNARLGV